jgi:hypothetical protein
VWSKIEASIEAALQGRRALHSAMIMCDWSVQPDWQLTNAVGQLVRYVQSIMDHTRELEQSPTASPDQVWQDTDVLPGRYYVQDAQDALPGWDDTSDWEK